MIDCVMCSVSLCRGALHNNVVLVRHVRIHIAQPAARLGRKSQMCATTTAEQILRSRCLVGKMLVYAAMLQCTDPVLTIAAALGHGRPVFVSPPQVCRTLHSLLGFGHDAIVVE